MVQFQSLRLSGFKSFVDKVELDIGKGLTGVVGPNGCGKSNLVEALRWVMGENSAKRMRGDSMEDVIFAGTSARPARNRAEINLVLSDEQNEAPAPYTGKQEIEVTRRIERDQGSTYKINGKNVRARDIHLLFADTLTGAQSPSLVSQGRVTSIINAKPADRRSILEESAGISGIYTRRHEAELRLRAADTNLERVEDQINTMQGQLGHLRKQSRQAERYKDLSAKIRELDMHIALLEYNQANSQYETARDLLSQCERAVAEKLATVSRLTQEQTTKNQKLPALRNEQAESAASYQSQHLYMQRLEDELNHIQTQIGQYAEQISQLEADLEREREQLADNEQSLEKIEQEKRDLAQEQDNEESGIEQAQARKQALETEVEAQQNAYEQSMAELADLRARKNANEAQITEYRQRLQQQRERRQELESGRETKSAELQAMLEDESAEDEIRRVEADINACIERAEQKQNELEALETEISTLENQRRESDAERTRLKTEIETLQGVLGTDQDAQYRPVIQDIDVTEGFETALSRALGDTLNASVNDRAQQCWLPRDEDRIAVPEMPEGVEPLNQYVAVPGKLKTALAFIGLVHDEEKGAQASAELAPGQSLVTKDGTYWRWDGYHARAEANDSRARQLQQQKRLEVLEAELPAIESTYEQHDKGLRDKREQHDTTRQRVREIQAELHQLRQQLDHLYAQARKATEARHKLDAEIARLDEGMTNCDREIARLEEGLHHYSQEGEDTDTEQITAYERQVESQKYELEQLREQLREAGMAYERKTQEKARRQARMQAIADERVNLQNKIIRGRERIEKLQTQLEQARTRYTELQTRPDEIEEEKQNLLTTLENLQKRRDSANDALAKAESELAETNKALKSAETELSQARESRAHAKASMEAAQSQLDQLHEQILEQFEKTPETLLAEANFQDDAGDIETCRSQREQYIRQREAIGPVNLRADVEAQELESELNSLLEERDDLQKAVQELRQGIAKLDKQARERLLTSFENVNHHFRNLFQKLFGGGKAYLALIDSEDPLGAGLEVYAEPPGKSLQSLSLLSGGEQTLTSIALIFAMFLTNPAPICVLDEIDAPLDDANVDRVCDLLEAIVEQCDTRFLVITHHRLTMARMNRLYGVTMPESGVSQLVSVDLEAQFDMLEAAE